VIAEDFKIAQEIFNVLDSGIVNGYDSFEYTAHLFDDYMQEVLLVTLNGVESSNVETDLNGAILYSLVNKLKLNSLSRRENWKSFTMTYSKGERVNIKYCYE